MRKSNSCFFILSILIIATFQHKAFSDALEPNEIPMFGNIQKSPAMKAADEDFIKTATNAPGGKVAAAKQMIDRGWALLQTGDSKGAIRRFNQAWLLTPKNADVYWGFGAATGQQGDEASALLYLEKAHALKPGNARLMVDLGRTYAQAKKFEKAFDLLGLAVRKDSNLEQAYATWAIALYESGNYKEAWNKVKASRRSSHSSLPPPFVDALTAKMREPK